MKVSYVGIAQCFAKVQLLLSNYVYPTFQLRKKKQLNIGYGHVYLVGFRMAKVLYSRIRTLSFNNMIFRIIFNVQC